MSEKKEKSSKLTAVQKKLIIGIVCALLGLLLIGGGIYCGVTDQNPKEAVVGLFTPRDQAICANWDSQDKPGVLAFVFYSDGTCDRYISTWNFDCEYTIKGNKLTIEDADTKKTLVYRFSIVGKVLTLTLLEEDGKEAEEQQVTKFDQVDELHMKSLNDMINDAKEKQAEKQTEQIWKRSKNSSSSRRREAANKSDFR